MHIASRVVVDLPMGLGRLSDPRDGLNVTFGAIEAGHAPNVIPTEAHIQGSLRASGRGAWESASQHLPGLLAAIVEPLGATWELEHRRGAPPIINDPWAVTVVERVGATVLGPEGVGPTAQSAGGEDFLVDPLAGIDLDATHGVRVGVFGGATVFRDAMQNREVAAAELEYQVEARYTGEVDLGCLSAFGAELHALHSQAELGNEVKLF